MAGPRLERSRFGESIGLERTRNLGDGVLDPSDWSAQWIAHPTWTYGQPLPIFAQQFIVSKPVRRARLYITGLGVYVATLNARPVTDDVLAPGGITKLYPMRPASALERLQ